jgi:hypothetical protein
MDKRALKGGFNECRGNEALRKPFRLRKSTVLSMGFALTINHNSD